MTYGLQSREEDDDMKSSRRKSTARALAFKCIFATLVTVSPTLGLAASGTMQVAWVGSPVVGHASGPQGRESFVNLPARTTGWGPWLTECSNDVKLYRFHTDSLAELNALIEKFAAIKSDHLQILLAPEPGPRDGAEFHGESAELSIGDQNALNQWFDRLEIDADGVRHFGVHRFEKPPTAWPPTLTIFLNHKSMKVGELRIPPEIPVKRLAPRRAISNEITTIF